ncbi:M4 family metallopeptidase [Myxococcus dinghuensis]|uniref:M4 family metallopeptidase n=1 Tax=Myxococcus dinghuensis TaxID=2906761 RepID=UPI002B20A92C|nr:M4 family metallopeptidase [Myxococcus dinghuensis]
MRGRGSLGVAVLCLAMGACTDANTPKEAPAPAAGKASAPLAGGYEIVARDADQAATYVKGALGSVPREAAAVKASQADALAPVLAQVAPLFRVSPEQLFLKRAYVGSDGDSHFRFGVKVNDLVVMGAELRLHARDGQVFAANGDARGDLPAPQGAAISAEQAIASALGDKASPPRSTVEGAPQLLYRRDGGQLLLAYALHLTGEWADGRRVDDTVLVNARNGDAFERISRIHSALYRVIYDGHNSTPLPGSEVRREGDPPVADPVVNAAYDNLGFTYQCYFDLFGRDSYDRAGAPLLATVHYRANYVNAFWDGTQMIFGDGDGSLARPFAFSTDVTAHELTHAVTQFESDLIYSGESGGLNESISDIFGNVCEWHSRGKVVTASTWMLGEDVWTPDIEGDAVRYMNNPTRDGSSLDRYEDYSAGVDVHYSSGISNLAFYLLSEGGVHPRFPLPTPVVGIGIEKAARIFYKANTDLLVPNANFESAKTLTEAAAAQLGYDAATVASVKAAWEAVGVGIVVRHQDLPLDNGVPVAVDDLRGRWRYFALSVPEGAKNLRFSLSGGTGDADLYVRYNNAPTAGTYDCRPFKTGNNEECSFAAPAAGKWFVAIYAYANYAGATLVGSYQGGFVPLEPGVEVGGLSAAQNDSTGFIVNIPERDDGGTRNITVRVQGASGNVDLYVRRLAIPTHSEYDCRSMKESGDERCDLKYVDGGKYYVWLYGSKGGFANASVIVTYR